MRTIRIEIDAGEKYCGDCRYFDFTEPGWACDLFYSVDVDKSDPMNYKPMRCPACLAAEVSRED